ncbi:MAG: GDP-mannose 4,6-dehydratase, partial [Phycisphaerae bacterium]
MQTVLVTGGAGFICSSFVHYLYRRLPDWRIVVLDAMTYAGNLENIHPDLKSDEPRYKFWWGNVNNLNLVDSLVAEADLVVHFAAESHVARSIFDDRVFFET